MQEKTHELLRPYDIGSLVAMVNAIDAGRKVNNPVIQWEKLAPDTLNGIPVRHYKFNVEYGFTQGEINAITRARGEYWLADLPVNFYNPFAGLARPTGAFTGEQAPAIAILYSALKELQVGTVLKFRAEGIINEGTMRPTIYVRTVEVQNLKEVEVDESIFQVPAGYRQTGRGATPAGGRRGGRGNDTTAAATDSAARGRSGRGTDTTAATATRDSTGRGRSGRGNDTTSFRR
jgi:hypothetical protein